jgi:hypothetical protein
MILKKIGVRVKIAITQTSIIKAIKTKSNLHLDE